MARPRSPPDPAGELAAVWHVYSFAIRSDEACRDSTPAPAARVPPVARETGEHTCGHGFIDRVMKRFDDRSLSYLGWTGSTRNRSPGPALITSYDGTPIAFGIGPREHLRAQD
ncbi:hypothetical protein [Streptomyces sp. NPDC053755]|uniref:hypothetical protein n=1 Tax=Streptomyces sp. NPDC053755 TaxID=3155815 RepID=UPI00341734A3